MDWTDPTVGESSEEKVAEMFGLVVGFSTRMCKRAANAQDEAIPSLEVPGGKRSRPSGHDEQVLMDLVIITVDSPKQVLESPSTIGGAA